MFPAIDTKNTHAVVSAVLQLQQELFPAHPTTLTQRLFADVDAMFARAYGDFAPNVLPYHDLEHTLQVTLCFARLLAGRSAAQAQPVFSPRDFERGLAAALMHDTGYLITRADTTGSGAHYTYNHVLRSCALAASYLPTCGFKLAEIEGVLGAIRCTGPAIEIDHLQFQSDPERAVCYCLVTADYLAQMADDHYPEKLAGLYQEFTESDEFLHIPLEQRGFQSATDLMLRTSAFWQHVVRSRLEEDYGGVFRYLATPYPDGPNTYINAIERNVALIATRLASQPELKR